MTMSDTDRVTVAIPQELHRQLVEAKPYGMTLREYTAELLEVALDER
jgi:hypothetical protein